MSSGYSPDDHRDEPRRLIGDTRLRAEPGADGSARTDLVIALMRAVDLVARRVSATPDDAPRGEVRRALSNATQLATQAAAGKAEAASLEGSEKLATIANLYAEARLKNAQAAQIEEQTALARLEAALRIAALYAGSVDAGVLGGGIEAVLLGEGLTHPAAIAETTSTDASKAK